MSDNHFITVSRKGELMARRRGGSPVCVATSAAGIEVETDDLARTNGAPPTVRVHFAPGGGNRNLNVLAVDVDGISLPVDAFLARFTVADESLGRWIRAFVERALDRR